MKGVRFDKELGWIGRCDACSEWWPLTEECWSPGHGVRRCRACLREMWREEMAMRRSADPTFRDRERMANRENARAKRAIYAERRRVWYARNRERQSERRKERYRAQREAEGKPYRTAEEVRAARLTDEERRRRRAEAAHRRYWEHREELLARLRERYRERKGQLDEAA